MNGSKTRVNGDVERLVRAERGEQTACQKGQSSLSDAGRWKVGSRGCKDCIRDLSLSILLYRADMASEQRCEGVHEMIGRPSLEGRRGRWRQAPAFRRSDLQKRESVRRRREGTATAGSG